MTLRRGQEQTWATTRTETTAKRQKADRSVDFVSAPKLLMSMTFGAGDVRGEERVIRPNGPVKVTWWVAILQRERMPG